MATNPSALPENSGRIKAPDANYLYGSAKDDSTGTTGDGTPIKKALMNDAYGFQQALLRAAGIVPTGTADTAIASQYLQGVVQQAMGRAVLFDESGAADAYILDLRINQQGPGVLFDGAKIVFPPGNPNTGASTADISALLGQAPGATVVNIKLNDGTTDPAAGDLAASEDAVLTYRTGPNRLELENPKVTGASAGLTNIVVITASGSYNKPVGLKRVKVTVIGGGGGGGGAPASETAAGGAAGGAAIKMIDAGALSASEAVTIGAGGSGGAAGSTTGVAGGTTSLGAHCSATGGSPGSGSTTVDDGSLGGLGSGGDLNLRGGAGFGGAGTNGSPPGKGGDSIIGGGAPGIKAGGQNATSAGAGGSGGHENTAGGDGAGGIVIIEEIF